MVKDIEHIEPSEFNKLLGIGNKSPDEMLQISTTWYGGRRFHYTKADESAKGEGKSLDEVIGDTKKKNEKATLDEKILIANKLWKLHIAGQKKLQKSESFFSSFIQMHRWAKGKNHAANIIDLFADAVTSKENLKDLEKPLLEALAKKGNKYAKELLDESKKPTKQNKELNVKEPVIAISEAEAAKIAEAEKLYQTAESLIKYEQFPGWSSNIKWFSEVDRAPDISRGTIGVFGANTRTETRNSTNLSDAIEWYKNSNIDIFNALKNAAKFGNAKAQYRLANWYHNLANAEDFFSRPQVLYTGAEGRGKGYETIILSKEYHSKNIIGEKEDYYKNAVQLYLNAVKAADDPELAINTIAALNQIVSNPKAGIKLTEEDSSSVINSLKSLAGNNDKKAAGMLAEIYSSGNYGNVNQANADFWSKKAKS